MRKRESVFSCLAIISSFIGGCGLILLSVFDTQRHPSIHRAFLLVFMLGVVASAIFTVVEVMRHQMPLHTSEFYTVTFSSDGSAKTLFM
jgi:hypothetical protein